MKITEVTKSAKKIIKDLSEFYVTYAVSPSSKAIDDLLNCIDSTIDSADNDIRSNAIYYKNLLIEDLFNILQK